MPRHHIPLTTKGEALALIGEGLSSRAVAARLGIDKATVNRWAAASPLQTPQEAFRKAGESSAPSPQRFTVEVPLAEFVRDTRATGGLVIQQPYWGHLPRR